MMKIGDQIRRNTSCNKHGWIIIKIKRRWKQMLYINRKENGEFLVPWSASDERRRIELSKIYNNNKNNENTH